MGAPVYKLGLRVSDDWVFFVAEAEGGCSNDSVHVRRADEAGSIVLCGLKGILEVEIKVKKALGLAV